MVLAEYSLSNALPPGLTAVGGMVLAGGGWLPGNAAQALAALAVLVSAVNIGGGFTITQVCRLMQRCSGLGLPQANMPVSNPC